MMVNALVELIDCPWVDSHTQAKAGTVAKRRAETIVEAGKEKGKEKRRIRKTPFSFLPQEAG